MSFSKQRTTTLHSRHHSQMAGLISNTQHGGSGVEEREGNRNRSLHQRVKKTHPLSKPRRPCAGSSSPYQRTQLACAGETRNSTAGGLVRFGARFGVAVSFEGLCDSRLLQSLGLVEELALSSVEWCAQSAAAGPLRVSHQQQAHREPPRSLWHLRRAPSRPLQEVATPAVQAG
jgi:hypothetical protein